MTPVDFSAYKSSLLRGHRNHVRTLAWSNDGRRLATGATDRTVRIWTPERSTDVKYSTQLVGHTDGVDQLAWDPSQIEQLATASADKTVRFWDIRQAKVTQTVNTPGSTINLAYTSDGTILAVGDRSDLISFIDIRTSKIVHSYKSRVEVNEMLFSPNGDILVLSTGEGRVEIYSYPGLVLLHTLEAHTSQVYCLSLDPKGRYLATGGADALVGLWDTTEWYCKKTVGKFDHPVRALSFSWDGEYIASASEEHVIDISNVRTGVSAHRIPTTAPTNAVAFHPSKYCLAYAGDDKEFVSSRVGPSGHQPTGYVRILGLHAEA